MITRGAKQRLNLDPYWNNVILFLNMEGSSGGTVFKDLAPIPHNFSIKGFQLVTKLDNKKWGTSSAYTQNDGKLEATALTGDALNGDFTIEFWAYPLDTSSGSSDPGGWLGWGDYNTGITFFIGKYIPLTPGYLGIHFASSDYEGSTVPIPLNTWSHIALVRSGTTIMCFLNGVKRIIDNLSTTITPSKIRIMGYMGDANDQTVPNSYLDAVRVTKGIARYTENFDHHSLAEYFPYTLPKDPYWKNVVLFMNMEGPGSTGGFHDYATIPHTFAISGSGLTTSSTKKKWGATSAYTNNTGKLIAPALTGDTLVGDFTIECWVYQLNRTYGGTNSPGWIGWGTSASGITLHMRIDAPINYFACYINDTLYTASDSAIPLNTWSHLAIVRSSNSVMGFLNGVKKNITIAIGTIIPSGSNIRIMGWTGSTSDSVPSSYLDAVRVTKGIARYTENFDPTTLIEFPRW